MYLIESEQVLGTPSKSEQVRGTPSKSEQVRGKVTPVFQKRRTKAKDLKCNRRQRLLVEIREKVE
jgi:hypothetical protein